MQTIKKSETINKIAHQFGLKLMVQFGSSVKDNYLKHPESDIDIAFLPQKKIDYSELADMQYLMAKHFNVVEDKIDLIDLSKTNSLLTHQVANTGKVLFDKDKHQYNQFYLLATKKFIDEKNIYNLEEELLKQKIEEKND